MADNDFKTVEYLKKGNERQRKCYDLLESIRIFEVLRAYAPVLTGTIPIEIDLPESDLDIICETHDFTEFREIVRWYYSNYDRFTDRLSDDRYVAVLFVDGQEIEIFAEAQPTEQQFAYRHMIIEHRMLQLFGEPFRREVIRLKREGYKTEPAFAVLLGLSGNPYQALLETEQYSDEDLLRMFKFPRK